MSDNSLNKKFINLLVKDFEGYTAEAFDCIVKYKKKQDESTRVRTKYLFKTSRTMLELLYSIADRLEAVNRETLIQFINILNYNMKVLVGPSSFELILRDPAAFGFDPKDFLRKIIILFLKLEDYDFYEQELLSKALKICCKKSILNPSELQGFKNLVEKLDMGNINKEQKEVPEHFIDPLTYLPMKTPVVLKTSNVTVDKSTFDMLLLNSAIDPFNRGEMTIDGYTVNEELQKEINEFYNVN